MIIDSFYSSLKSFPKGEELFPFKKYETWKDFYHDVNRSKYLPKNDYSNLGQIQEIIRNPIGKAAAIIFDKYKRKYNLDSNAIEEITLFASKFKEERESQGKKCTDDFLIQKCSEYVKNKYNTV